MSWDQGVVPREELPPKFLAWADSKMSEPLQYITWFGMGPPIILDFGDSGALETHMDWAKFSAMLDKLGGGRND